MIYREAKAEDIPRIMEVRNSVKENVLPDPTIVTAEDCRDYLFRRGKGWVCEVDSLIIGFSIVSLLDKSLWALFLHPEFEKRGIGRKLHELALQWYFEQTKEDIWLSTAYGTRAEQFYQKAGWKAVGAYSEEEVKFEMTYAEWEAHRAFPKT